MASDVENHERLNSLCIGHGIGLRSFGHAMLQLRKLFEDAQSVPPCVGLADLEPSFAMPSDFSVRGFPGLVLCYVFRDSSGSRLVTYWRSREDANTTWPALASALHIRSIFAPGSATDSRFMRKPFFARFRLNTVALGIVAFLGAVSALRDHFGEYLEDAALGIRYSETLPLNVIEGRPFSTPVHVLNRARVAPAAITQATARLERSGHTVALQLAIEDFAALRPGERGDLLLDGVAPASSADAAPEEWRAKGSLAVSSALARSSKMHPLPERVVRVWPAFARTKPVAQLPCDSRCRYSGKIYVGEASDRVQGEASLSHSKLAIVHFTLHGAPDARIGAPEGESPDTKVGWVTGPVKAFSSLDYDLYVKATDDKPLRADEWQALQFDIDP